MHLAKEKLEKKEAAALKHNAAPMKEKQYNKWRGQQKQEHQKTGSDTLLQPTKTYDMNKITPVQLYVQQEQRSKQGAHSRQVPSGGYDLRNVGRSTPAWTKGTRMS